MLLTLPCSRDACLVLCGIDGPALQNSSQNVRRKFSDLECKNPVKILTIFGTRPEAIKLAPIIKALKDRPHQFNSLICVTAQHREMLDQVLHLFDIQPDHDLNIMKPRQDLFGVTSEVLLKLRDLLGEIKPDLILVQGDTTTTFAASLAAFYQKIRIGHIEAGLRTYEKYRPFPEEINRHLTSVVADYHFVPTRKAKGNLLKEGMLEQHIYITGNTVIDALLWVLKKQSPPENQRRMKDYFSKTFGISTDHQRLILVTAHRRESFGKGFENICQALKEIVVRNADIQIVYPVHLNPNVQEPVHRIIGEMERVHLIGPLDYEPFVYLMSKASLILTDSGGIQEEAPSVGKPVLVMREVTERPEAVDAGTAKLVGTEVENIVSETERLLDHEEDCKRMTSIKNPYGDGKASERIVSILAGKRDWEPFCY
jgi:UDP-N-acetylglucosamine 2-epimerase (non-hydrolysing)